MTVAASQAAARPETVDSLLAFLTTSCAPCQPHWEALADWGTGGGGGPAAPEPAAPEPAAPEPAAPGPAPAAPGPAPGAPAGGSSRPRLVVVTPSRAMEDESRARRLVPPGAHLHMGSETWFMYGVGQAGTFVLVRSPRQGSPPWAQAGDVLGWASLPDPGRLAELVERWRAAPLSAGPG